MKQFLTLLIVLGIGLSASSATTTSVYINVLDFGADGTDGADDYPAFQDAIDSACFMGSTNLHPCRCL